MSEWRPGDVAIGRVGCHGARPERLIKREDGDWVRLGVHSRAEDCLVEDLRPLVVIDPGNAEHLDRLAIELVEAMHRAGDVASAANGVHPATVAEALHRFIRPTPRIEEPTARWSRVLDDEGREWCRTEWDDGMNKPWQHEGMHAHWRGISPVRILSDGVTEGES